MAKRKRQQGQGASNPLAGLSGGGLGALGGGGMAKKIQDMQEQMMATQESLGDEIVEGSAGGGVVKVQVSGHQEIKSLEIDPEVVDPEDVEMLQDLIIAALNEAITKSKDLAGEKMEGLTGGLNIPGLF